MPPFTVVAGWVAGVLSLVAFVPYIVAILRGETRPNRATWWIEDRLAWALFIAGNTFNLVAVDRWEFAIAIYPIYFFLASGTIAALVLRPRGK